MKKPYIIYLLISLSMLAIVWVIFSVYQKSITTTISEKIQTDISPIKPDFDSKIIESIKRRETIEAVYDTQEIKPQSVKTSSSSGVTSIPTVTIFQTSSQGATPGGNLQ